MKSNKKLNHHTRDLSIRKQLERKLKTANADLDRFVHVISHNLQEPLSAQLTLILHLEELIANKGESEIHELMKRVLNANQRISGLIYDLLNYFRLGKDKILKDIDLGQKVKEIWSSFEFKASPKPQLLIKTPLPKIKAYVEELEVLFRNLIENAIKFQKKGSVPHVSISASKSDNEWLFEVSDNGIGIEEEYIKKLFVIFQRLHHSEQYPGNGIGLAHCKKIVELHGGKIWLESKVDLGTHVFFTIPTNTKEFL